MNVAALIVLGVLNAGVLAALVKVKTEPESMDLAVLAHMQAMNEQWADLYQSHVAANQDHVEFLHRALIAATNPQAALTLAKSEQVARMDPREMIHAVRNASTDNGPDDVTPSA